MHPQSPQRPQNAPSDVRTQVPLNTLNILSNAPSNARPQLTSNAPQTRALNTLKRPPNAPSTGSLAHPHPQRTLTLKCHPQSPQLPLNAVNVPSNAPPSRPNTPSNAPRLALKRVTNTSPIRPQTRPQAHRKCARNDPQMRPQCALNTPSNAPSTRPQRALKHVPNASPTRPQTVQHTLTRYKISFLCSFRI